MVRIAHNRHVVNVLCRFFLPGFRDSAILRPHAVRPACLLAHFIYPARIPARTYSLTLPYFVRSRARVRGCIHVRVYAPACV